MCEIVIYCIYNRCKIERHVIGVKESTIEKSFCVLVNNAVCFEKKYVVTPIR
jgi:hypothetical protein